MNQVIFKVVAEIRRREIDFDTDFWETSLDKFNRWYKVTVCTNESYNVSSIHNTIFHHADRDIYIRFLFFRSGNSTFAVGTNNMFLQIFTSDNLEPLIIEKFICV